MPDEWSLAQVALAGTLVDDECGDLVARNASQNRIRVDPCMDFNGDGDATI
jgi:hypothetical protein